MSSMGMRDTVAVRVLLTAVRCLKGEVTANLERHRELLEIGRAEEADLVLFPEMSLTGYRASTAITLDHPAVDALIAATAAGPAVCFGIVEFRGAGLAPFITQIVAAGGDVTVVHRKAHLGEGEEPDFAAGEPTAAFELFGRGCEIAVCAEIGVERAYSGGADVVLGPAAPGLYGPRRSDDDSWRRGFDWWTGSTRADAARLLRPGQRLVVSTQAGATDDEDFPGWAGALRRCDQAADDEVQVLAELPDWREGTLLVDV